MDHPPIAVPIATAAAPAEEQGHGAGSGGGGGQPVGGGGAGGRLGRTLRSVFSPLPFKVGDHEVHLSYSAAADGDGLVIAAKNTLTGDEFETTLTSEKIEKAHPFISGNAPDPLRTLEGFAQFLGEALAQEGSLHGPAASGFVPAPSGSAPQEGVECSSVEVDGAFAISVNVETGTGWATIRFAAAVEVPLVKAATADTKHALALRKIREEFTREKEAMRAELTAEMDARSEEMGAYLVALREEMNASVGALQAQNETLLEV